MTDNKLYLLYDDSGAHYVGVRVGNENELLNLSKEDIRVALDAAWCESGLRYAPSPSNEGWRIIQAVEAYLTRRTN